MEAILCRDLDSHITPREVAAVEEFFSYPELTFHTMRDHPAHTAPVMGGMWGAKVERDRQKWIESFRAMYKVREQKATNSLFCWPILHMLLLVQNGLLRRTRKNKGTDQEALRRFVWPWAQRQSLAHDAYFCTSFPGRARPFPTRRAEGVGNFVGGVFDLNATLRFDDERNVCPEVCRKRPDWTFCWAICDTRSNFYVSRDDDGVYLFVCLFVSYSCESAIAATSRRKFNSCLDSLL